MTRYQLAKLVDWAGTLRGRKRLQKVVYLLQSGGCPLKADYFLHHYGPYSEEVARLTDEMVRQKLLVEGTEGSAPFEQYSYRLSDDARRQLAELEANEEGRSWQSQLDRFEAKARSLLAADLKQLEYAATIVYFRNQGHVWSDAVEKAVSFKKAEAVRDALSLAEQAAA